MSLYGAVPLLHAHSSRSSVGVFHLTAAETWIDVTHNTTPSFSSSSSPSGISTHWLSESGILDLFLLPGSSSPTSRTPLFSQYASLVGPSALPAHWALGYHQCRWNYLDRADVLDVDARFDSDGEGFPLDVTWLDIEYAEEHKYFDWDEAKFPNVKGMLKLIEDKGRKVRRYPFLRAAQLQAQLSSMIFLWLV
jgi:alpha 1,3-glucosidase